MFVQVSTCRIDSPKILLWQERCLMRESYQSPLWENPATGRKRGHDEYHESERVVSSGGSALPSSTRRGAQTPPGGVPPYYRLPSHVSIQHAQSSDHDTNTPP